MPRVPQVLLTLSPSGTIMAELPGPSGARRHVPIDDDNGMSTIRRMLSAQLSQRPQTIGLDGKPTTAQVLHWQRHLDVDNPQSDPMCPWCIAAELGIDTTERAYHRAQAILRERRTSNRRPFSYAGDGTVKVYHAAVAGRKSKPQRVVSMAGLLDDEEEEEN